MKMLFKDWTVFEKILLIGSILIVSFTGSYVSGMTTLTASYGDLTSSIMVETSDEVYLQLLNYAVYKGGKMSDKEVTFKKVIERGEAIRI